MKLLIVEDEPALRASLLDYLQQDGYVVKPATTYAQAHEKLRQVLNQSHIRMAAKVTKAT